MKKKFLNILLTGLMLFVLLPINVNKVKAEEYTPNYLTFTAEQANSTVSFSWVKGDNVEYCTKISGVSSGWISYIADTQITLPSIGDQVSFKAKNIKTDVSVESVNHFYMTGKIAASGSVTSLTDENGGNPNVTLGEGCYLYMFSSCKSLTAAPELPATSLAKECYESMFTGCSSLTAAPELPATSLTYECYAGMFYNCTSLTAAPELPATSLAYGCYKTMFYKCTSLTAAPELPATSLASECYTSMFNNCTSLTAAPELPATSLASECYKKMFYNCTSLTAAPELPATSLAMLCYQQMFCGCTNLTAPAVMGNGGIISIAKDYTDTHFTGNGGCMVDMYKNCTNLKIYDTKTTPDYTRKWRVNDTTSTTDNNYWDARSKWNSGMFDNKTIEADKDYYIKTLEPTYSLTEPDITSWVYDSISHSGAAKCAENDVEIKYQISTDGVNYGDYTDDIPVIENVGNLYVKAIACKEGYYDTDPISYTLTITKKELTATTVVEDKYYDGTTKAYVTASNLTGIVNNDTVLIDTVSGEYDTKEVGTNKDVAVTYTLTGTDAAKYFINDKVVKAAIKDIDPGIDQNGKSSYIEGAAIDSDNIKDVFKLFITFDDGQVNHSTKYPKPTKFEVKVDNNSGGSAYDSDIREILKVAKGNKCQGYKTIVELTYGDQQSQTEEIKDTKGLIKIIYDFNFNDRKDVQLFRVHNGTVEELTETPNGDGEYIELNITEGTVTVYSKNYSTYAITYTAIDPPYKVVNTGVNGFNNNTLKLIGLISLLGITTVVATKKKKH